jgi:tetratricopeptide (TPR) repeat protein
MNVRSLPRYCLALALSIGVFGQTKAPVPGGPGAPTAPSNPTSPGRSNIPSFPGTQPGTTPDFSDRPIFLSGKVVLEDGTPPPEPVVIQLVCRGNPRGIAYSDAKGNFSADLSERNRTVLADASETSGDLPIGVTPGSTRGACPGEPNLMGAEVQAYLAGYRSDVVNLGSRRSMDNPDVGTLVLRRLANVEGLTISATSRMAPKDAQKALAKGREDATKQKWQEAEKQFEKAVEIYPKYAAAWFDLGRMQQEQKDLEGARKSYAQSLAADPKYVNPYLQLASMAAAEQKWQEVADDSDRLLRLNPVDFPQAWFFNSLANYYLGKRDEAEKSAREGISHDPAHHFPRMSYLLGVILSQRRDFAASAENLRDYVRYAPRAADVDQVKKQLADVEKALGPEAQKQ